MMRNRIKVVAAASGLLLAIGCTAAGAAATSTPVACTITDNTLSCPLPAAAPVTETVTQAITATTTVTPAPTTVTQPPATVTQTVTHTQTVPPPATSAPTTTTTPPLTGSVKAVDSANVINDPAWFVARKAEGVELYVMHATNWGACTPWSRTQIQLKMALDAGMRIAAYTRDPRCWSGGIDAAGPYAAQLQFFALDVETDPGVKVTRAMVDGIAARGVRPIIYSGSGMWPQVMSHNVTSFADVPLWDTNAKTVAYSSWTANVSSPTPVAYGGWNTPANPRVIVQQAFEVTIGGVAVDLNSVRGEFLR